MEKVFYSDDQISGNLRRATKKGLLSTISRKELVMLTDKYFRDKNGVLHCAYSWNPINSNSELNLEHIIPISRGGGTVLFNIVPCLSIINGNSNKQKSTQNLLDWWEGQDFYKIELLENLVNYVLDAYEITLSNQSTNNDFIFEEESNADALPVSVNDIKNNYSVINKEKISYDKFILSCILKLKEHGVDISVYEKRISKLYSENSFEFFEKQKNIQNEFMKVLKIYCPEYKYDIVSSINYFRLLKEFEGKSIEEIIGEITKRISEVHEFCISNGISASEVIHSIIEEQSFLWNNNYSVETLEKLAFKRLDDLCDEIEKFCKNIGWFPRSVITDKSVRKLIENCTDEEIFELRLRTRYQNNSKQFNDRQKRRLKELKKEFGRQKLINTDELFDEIVEFSKLKWFPRGSLGVKRNTASIEDKKEFLLYSNFRGHLSKFTKTQIDIIEDLQKSRNYLRVSFERQYNAIVEFVEANGYFPRITGGDEERNLYNSYLRNRENFTNEQVQYLEQIKNDNKFHDFNATAVVGELRHFIEINGRFPQSEIRRDGIRLHAEDFSENEQYEVNLYAKYRRARCRIDDSIIDELDALRDRIYYDELYQSIINFIDENGHFPIGIIKRVDGNVLKTNELSKEEQLEKRLNANYLQARRKNKFSPSQISHLLMLQKSKNIYIERRNKVFEDLVDFVKVNGRFPSQLRNGNSRNELSKLELEEARLNDSYYRMKDKFTFEQTIILDKLIEEMKEFKESGTKKVS